MATEYQRDAALQALLDKQEIHEAVMRYCRGIDRCDEELVRSVFHADSTVDYGEFFRGSGPEFAKMIVPILLQTWKSTMHFIGTNSLELAGDVAYSEAYFVAYSRLERDGKEYDQIGSGRYVDRFERRDSAWKIADRVLVGEWNRVDAVVESGLGGATLGHRSRQDISYRR